MFPVSVLHTNYHNYAFILVCSLAFDEIVVSHINMLVQLRKFGAKNIEVGVGCGVGFGHGFGAGMSYFQFFTDVLAFCDFCIIRLL